MTINFEQDESNCRPMCICMASKFIVNKTLFKILWQSCHHLKEQIASIIVMKSKIVAKHATQMLNFYDSITN